MWNTSHPHNPFCIKVPNKSFEDVSKFKFLGMMVLYQNCFHEETELTECLLVPMDVKPNMDLFYVLLRKIPEEAACLIGNQYITAANWNTVFSK